MCDVMDWLKINQRTVGMLIAACLWSLIFCGRKKMSVFTHYEDKKLEPASKIIEKKLEACFNKHNISAYRCRLYLELDVTRYVAILELSMLDIYNCEMKVYAHNLSQLLPDLIKRLERQINKMYKKHISYRDRLRVPSLSRWYVDKLQTSNHGYGAQIV